MDPLQIGDQHFGDSRHFVSILSISRQFAGRHFAVTFISIYCRHFAGRYSAEMITYMYIYIYIFEDFSLLNCKSNYNSVINPVRSKHYEDKTKFIQQILKYFCVHVSNYVSK